MVRWHIAQALVGILVIVLGLMVSIAREKSGLKRFMEVIFFSGNDMFDRAAEYASLVNFAGWKSFFLGVAIALPLSALFDNVLLFGAIALSAWFVARGRKKYLEACKEVEANLAPKG